MIWVHEYRSLLTSYRFTVPRPLACWSYANVTGAQYWERKKLENARHGRRLSEPLSLGEWILGVRRINILHSSLRYMLGEVLNIVLC